MCVDKTCTCCGEVKPSDAFYAGRGKCKPCLGTQQKAYAIKNAEKRKASAKSYVAANKEKTLARQYAWREANIEKVRAQLRERYQNNKEQMLAYQSVWSKENPEKRSAITRKWDKNNAPIKNAATARRRATKFQATPSWANEFIIAEAYSLAELRTKMLGFKWEVDHMVPLQSKIVCGLHVHTNIQVIPKIENIKKGNRVWENMP